MRLRYQLSFLCVLSCFVLAVNAKQPLDNWVAPNNGSTPYTLDTLTQHFVSGGGYKPLPEDSVVATLDKQLVSSGPVSALPPSASLPPLVLAALALDATEVPLDRVRYRIRYGTAKVGTDAAATSLSLIQVDRFNLGPVMRDALIADIGPEHVAPAHVFGVGPHVSWRLITRPLMGHSALPVTVAKTEITNEQAETMMCLDQLCTSLDAMAGHGAVWSQDNGHTDIPQNVAYTVMQDGLLTTAAALDLLAAELIQEPRESASQAQPFAELVVERNLGQDSSLAATLREGALMDDSVKAIWKRIRALPGGDGSVSLFSDKAYECYRGDVDFAQPGQYCP